MAARKRVEFTKNCAGIGYSYMKGQKYDIPVALAVEMIEMGYAKEIPIPIKKTRIPPDFPGYRALKDSGFVDIEELRRIGDVEQLQEIKGIGKTTAQQIMRRL